MTDRPTSDKIAEALLNCITQADAYDLQTLFDTVEDYRSAYPRTFRNVREQPFCRKLLDAILEAKRCMEEDIVR